MVKRPKRKIPRNAVEPLMQTCEMLSKEWKKTATEIFKDFLELMDRYADYFFSKPWPEKYNYEEATTFTDEDLDFLFESEHEFSDRYKTVCLKKNINLEIGFMGYFGIFWTQQAFHEKFVRPQLKPLLEAFETLAEREDNAQRVLNKLKEQFISVRLIHLSLIDLLEHEYLDKTRQLLVSNILELIHTEEGLPPCNEYRCELQRKELREILDKS